MSGYSPGEPPPKYMILFGIFEHDAKNTKKRTKNTKNKLTL